jgi:hypothetical protein
MAEDSAWNEGVPMPMNSSFHTAAQWPTCQIQPSRCRFTSCRLALLMHTVGCDAFHTHLVTPWQV